MNAKLKIVQVGPSVSVQDGGRAGHLRFGVSGSGAMDRAALVLANAALNNSPLHPAVEVSLGGITVECSEGSVSIAIVGGAFNSQLNNAAIPAWSMCSMQAGDTLKIRPGTWGSWCYLAFAGQLKSPKWLNSYSVHLNSGVCGKPLQQDDILNVTNAVVVANETCSLGDPESLQPQNLIRAVIGPQERFFDTATIEKLFDHGFTVSNEYDRMGMRLTGCTLPINAALDMPSEPISRGSLQVPGHGDPICLMADHHTAGGYPKIATVISADQDTLSQHRTGDTVRFVAVTTAQAVQIAREHASQFDQALKAMLLNKVSVTERLWASNLISGAATGLE